MRDEHDVRLWQSGRAQTYEQIDRLLSRIMQSFCVLHQINWSAPWNPMPPCRR